MSREWHLKTPLSENDVRQLELMDVVYLTGLMWGIRDMNLRRLIDDGVSLPKGVDYRGYPVLHEAAGFVKKGDKYLITSGMGTTTSTRMERWMPTIISKYGARAIVGKGGLLEGTTEACKEYGAVYLAICGGAASYLDGRLNPPYVIHEIFWEDLVSQAIAKLETKDYGPCIVGIDAHGNNQYFNIREKVLGKRQEIYEKLGVQDAVATPEWIRRPSLPDIAKK